MTASDDLPGVLIVEDGRLAAATLRIQLESLGYDVLGVFDNGEEAVRCAPDLRPDIALVDIMLCGALDGVETAARLAAGCNLPIIFITSSQDVETFQRAKRVNPFGYLAKPVAADTLHRSIEMAIHKKKLEQRLLESEARYRLIVESLNDGLAILDAGYHIRYCNTKLVAMLQNTGAVALHAPFTSLLHPGSVSRFLLTAQSAATSGFASFGGNLQAVDDVALPVRVGVSCRKAKGNRQSEYVCVLTDVSELVASAAAQREAEAKYRTIFENAHEGIFQARADGRFLEVNPSMAALFGFPDAATMLHEVPSLCALFATGAEQGEHCLPFLASQESVHGFQLQLMTRKGDTVWVELSCHTVLDAAGNVNRLEGMIIDVTERRKHELHLLRLATKDDLTGVSNRAAFRDMLKKSVEEVKESSICSALLYIDLNYFKKVNDKYGHYVGDMVLREVAARLSSRVRTADVIGRVGGDEFCVLLRGVGGVERAVSLAEDMRGVLDKPFENLPEEHRLGMSIGVLLLQPPDVVDAGEAMRRADSAMYHAKTTGRGVVVWEEGMLQSKAC